MRFYKLEILIDLFPRTSEATRHNRIVYLQLVFENVSMPAKVPRFILIKHASVICKIPCVLVCGQSSLLVFIPWPFPLAPHPHSDEADVGKGRTNFPQPICCFRCLHRSLTPIVYARVGELFRTRFGPHAGWAHSLLFAAELPHCKVSPLLRTRVASNVVRLVCYVGWKSMPDASPSAIVRNRLYFNT